MAKKKKSFLKKILVSFLILLLLGLAGGGYFAYKVIYQPNVFLEEKKSRIIYIPTGSTFVDVGNILSSKGIIVNRMTFEMLAKRKKYDLQVKPGKYRILARMNNNALINLLRLGLQEPVRITFNGIRTKEQIISRVSNRIEADSAALTDLLNDQDFLLKKYGLRSDNVLTMFIPNSYEFYWNTSAEDFLDRIAKDYKAFWTASRKAQANEIGLSQTEVSILASIVQAEQSRFNEEKPIIAGLYINRLRKKMPLQSDPTLIYAIGDFTINRVLNGHKEIDSPYNTYKNIGLPPGPICLPEISSLDAVLNYDKNDYIYMCAKDDFSCKHNFAQTLFQHNIYAQKYRKALDRNNILH